MAGWRNRGWRIRRARSSKNRRSKQSGNGGFDRGKGTARKCARMFGFRCDSGSLRVEGLAIGLNETMNHANWIIGQVKVIGISCSMLLGLTVKSADKAGFAPVPLTNSTHRVTLPTE